MSFAEQVTHDIRLIILQALERTNGYSVNESILQSVLGDFGHRVSRDRVRTEIAWLADQGLATVDSSIGIMVATITERGVDAARGHATVPGVKRPGPGA